MPGSLMFGAFEEATGYGYHFHDLPYFGTGNFHRR